MPIISISISASAWLCSRPWMSLEVRGIIWDHVESYWRSVGSCGILWDRVGGPWDHVGSCWMIWGHMPRSNLKQLEAFILIYYLPVVIGSIWALSGIGDIWRSSEHIGACMIAPKKESGVPLPPPPFTECLICYQPCEACWNSKKEIY